MSSVSLGSAMTPGGRTCIANGGFERCFIERWYSHAGFCAGSQIVRATISGHLSNANV